jgi:magnesium chelatase subunit I
MAIRNTFLEVFPDPAKLKKKKENSEYVSIINWFAQSNILDIMDNENNKEYTDSLSAVEGLEDLIHKYQPNADGVSKFVLMEFALHGLAEHSLLSKNKLTSGISFKDLFNSLLSNS